MLCSIDKCIYEATRRGWCNLHYARWKRTGSTELEEKVIVTECKFDPTHKGPFVKGYCKNCYYRVWHTGNADYKVRPRLKCAVVECDKWAVAKGLCDTHRKRVDRKGSVEAGARPEGWGHRPTRRARERGRSLMKIFGITPEQYEEMFVAQEGLCKICKRPETQVDHRTGFMLPLSVDHDHDTGFIRGLLCTIHNRALGQFQDNVDYLQSAVDYLLDSNRRQGK